MSTTMTLQPIVYPLTILHGPGHTYAPWDCIHGVEEAHRLGATAIDIDAQPSADDDEFVALHWRFLGLHEHRGPADLNHKPVDKLTIAQLALFKAKKGGWRVRPMRDLMVVAARLGVTLCIEVKAAGNFEKLRADAAETGCRVIVMTLPHLGGKNAGYQRLAAAKAAGLPTMVLLNDTQFAAGQVPADQWKRVDYVKGPTKWQKGRPARVIRLGAGSKHGITVTPSNARAVTARLSKTAPRPTPPAHPVPTPVPAPPEVHVSILDKLIELAKAEVGYHEGRSGGHWNNIQKYSKQLPGAKGSDGQAWCDTWVHWLFWAAGALQLLPDVTAKAPAGSPGCDVTGNAWKRVGRWSEYPAIGAQVFFGSPADLNHTGFVIAYDATTITTIEGNTNSTGAREGDGVYLKIHQRRATNVVGYGYPDFEGGIKSADPLWVSGRKAGAVSTLALKIDFLDLSHHNDGRIDWPLAKAGGVRGVWHKATQGRAFRDDMYASRRAEIRPITGVGFGAYHYAEPSLSTGTAQAKFLLSVAKPRKGEFRPMLDLEEAQGLSMAKLTEWTADFVREIKRQVGQPPLLYTRFELTRDPGAFLWVARYHPQNAAPAVPKAWTRGWTVRQFSNGEVGVPHACPGVHMPVDLNTLKPGFDLTRLKLKKGIAA